MVCAGEAHFDAGWAWLRPLENLVQERALPTCGGDGVVAPGLTRWKGSHRESTVPGAFERDDALDWRQRSEVVEREREGVLDRAGDLERAVVIGYGKVAAHVVQRSRGNVAVQSLRGRLGVERRGMDHGERCALLFESSPTAISWVSSIESVCGFSSRRRESSGRGSR